MEEFEQNKDEEKIDTENSGSVGDNLDIMEKQKAYTAEKAAYNYARKFNREPLILALLGMAFSFLYGAGIVFAIIALIKGIRHYAVKPSRTLKWAITISIVCIVLCALYIICLTYAVIIASSVTPPEPTESIESIIN